MTELRHGEAERLAPGAEPGPLPLSLLRVDVGALTHVGKVRENNEDAYVVARAGRYIERMSSNLPESILAARSDDCAYIMLVADGMGGRAGGEVASHTALASTIQMMLSAPKWALKLDDPATRMREIREMWARARGYLDAVHAKLQQQAAAEPRLHGMGTTLTGAYSVGADLFVIHVGDSRAYLFRGGQVQKITRDHTLAQSYADMGILKQDDPAARQLRHVLTQAVGATEEVPRPDMHGLRLADGDRVLLCTDGLSNLVDEIEMAELLSRGSSSQDACQALIDLALECGAPDNVTAIVASYTLESTGQR